MRLHASHQEVSACTCGKRSGPEETAAVCSSSALMWFMLVATDQVSQASNHHMWAFPIPY
jgi:hypothetical protein